MAKTYNEVVNHLTRIVLHLRPDPDCYEAVNQADNITPDLIKEFSQVLASRAERVAAMMVVLQGIGFTFIAKDDVIYADSKVVEAFEAKEPYRLP